MSTPFEKEKSSLHMPKDVRINEEVYLFYIATPQD